MITVLQFYKYVDITNPEAFQSEYLPFLQEIGMKGRIYIASEGINASISGTKEQVAQFKQKLTQDKRFADMRFKEECALEHPFKKTQVKIKKEICSFKHPVDVKNHGKYVEPKELLQWYQDKEDFVIIDARNNYESKIGRFKGAICPNIEQFRDFPKLLPEFQQFKQKKIVMYCTGGIRCEKASAFMKEHGFNEVYHIKDGILNFLDQCPNTVWEGANFVFDNRMVVPQGNPLTSCERCHKPCDFYVNCSNVSCDKFTVMCADCQKAHRKCCSDACEKAHTSQEIKA